MNMMRMMMMMMMMLTCESSHADGDDVVDNDDNGDKCVDGIDDRSIQVSVISGGRQEGARRQEQAVRRGVRDEDQMCKNSRGYACEVKVRQNVEYIICDV